MATSEGEKTGGRKKGTPNKITKDLIQTLLDHDYDPLKEIIKIVNKEKPTAEQLSEYRSCLELSGFDEEKIEEEILELCNVHLSVKEKLKVHLQLLDYIYPKRKAIENSTKIASI